MVIGRSTSLWSPSTATCNSYSIPTVVSSPAKGWDLRSANDEKKRCAASSLGGLLGGGGINMFMSAVYPEKIRELLKKDEKLIMGGDPEERNQAPIKS